MFGTLEINRKFAHETRKTENMGTEQTGTQKQVFEKEKNRREKLASYFYNLSQLTFAGTILVNMPVLVNAVSFSIATAVLVIVGVLWTYTFAYIGNRFLIY